MNFYTSKEEEDRSVETIRREMISLLYQGILEEVQDHWDAERACWMAESLTLSELARWIRPFIGQNTQKHPGLTLEESQV